MTIDDAKIPSSSSEESSDKFIIELERFAGPLDLLLHLIREHEMDIFDIPISEITAKYLAYMKIIQELNLDQAGDFLVMAATLAHIKSKMLLPPSEDDEEELEDPTDPREELVRRLLEYQRFKDAAEQLGERPLLGRDVFIRPPEKIAKEQTEDLDIEEVSVYQLIEVFQEVLDRVRVHAPHQVQLDTVSVETKIRQTIAALRAGKRITFRSLFDNIYSRPELVATFLGVLELAKMRVMRIYQTAGGSEIYLSLRPDAPSDKELEDRIAAVDTDIDMDTQNGEGQEP